MNKKIIIVDDDPIILESLSIILEEEGYDVVSIPDGAELKRILEKTIPDLIVLDYQLPQENGAQIIRQLKKSQTTQRIPIIIISANQKIEGTVKAAGAEAFLEKPFDISLFLDTITEHLNS